ncbi:hypothetical protein [Photobacterium ganghwense]|uniref:hypothetical protein n=1 Tax=Photobacterium ganghwense TaxID=320778 RepID=UPI0039F0B2F1
MAKHPSGEFNDSGPFGLDRAIMLIWYRLLLEDCYQLPVTSYQLPVTSYQL